VLRDESGNEIGRKLFTIKEDDSENKAYRARNSRIFVLGDSFTRIFLLDPPQGAGWVAHLAKELAQPVQFKYNNGGASTIVRKNFVSELAKKPNMLKNIKLIVWEIVERDFRFGDGGWKDIRLDTKVDPDEAVSAE
jgi:hypothetical protein